MAWRGTFQVRKIFFLPKFVDSFIYNFTYLCLFPVSYLTQLDRKTDAQPSNAYMNPRMTGSPVKSHFMNKLEDYNDSGYGGSPLPPGMCILWFGVSVAILLCKRQ